MYLNLIIPLVDVFALTVKYFYSLLYQPRYFILDILYLIIQLHIAVISF